MHRLRRHSTLPAMQQPSWSDADSVDAVRAELAERPPLIGCARHRWLQADLARVVQGRAFVMQGGDCAELFADSSADRILAKAAQLTELGELFEWISAVPAVRIGRLAGQYAKPRSDNTEKLPDGQVVPVYRGDAVNGALPNPQAREADPRRLLAAYDYSRLALDELAGDIRYAGIHTSHEALLLDYEEPLTRTCDCHGQAYASSAPYVWIGDRTRQADGAHIAWAESIANPVGVKVGMSADLGEITEIVQRLSDRRPVGRLSLIVRMGADNIRRGLPKLITRFGDRVVWISDPMHGNTIRRTTGQKTRLVPDVLGEFERFALILLAHGLRPGGMHLEMTPAYVDECVDVAAGLSSAATCFTSACDPRLNPVQSRQAVRLAARLTGAGAAAIEQPALGAEVLVGQ